MMVLLVLAGCGGGSGQAKAAPPGSSAPAPVPAASAREEPEAAVPRAKIVEIAASNESVMYYRVRISFDNPTPSSCRFTSYTLVWPGGRKTIEEKPFEIPPGGHRQRTLKVHPNDGDLAKLKVDGSEIEVNAGCSNAGQ